MEFTAAAAAAAAVRPNGNRCGRFV